MKLFFVESGVGIVSSSRDNGNFILFKIQNIVIQQKFTKFIQNSKHSNTTKLYCKTKIYKIYKNKFKYIVIQHNYDKIN